MHDREDRERRKTETTQKTHRASQKAQEARAAAAVRHNTYSKCASCTHNTNSCRHEQVLADCSLASSGKDRAAGGEEREKEKKRVDHEERSGAENKEAETKAQSQRLVHTHARRQGRKKSTNMSSDIQTDHEYGERQQHHLAAGDRERLAIALALARRLQIPPRSSGRRRSKRRHIVERSLGRVQLRGRQGAVSHTRPSNASVQRPTLTGRPRPLVRGAAPDAPGPP